MNIKILGSGCPNCKVLEENAKKAVEELGLKDVQIEHIFEIDKIIEYGVMSTPAIVIDKDVKTSGRVPDVEEIKKMIIEEGENDTSDQSNINGCSCGGKC